MEGSYAWLCIPGGITTLEVCILSRGILLVGHSDMDMECDSVNMENDQQVLTKFLSLSTTPETLILLPMVEVFAWVRVDLVENASLRRRLTVKTSLVKMIGPWTWNAALLVQVEVIVQYKSGLSLRMSGGSHLTMDLWCWGRRSDEAPLLWEGDPTFPWWKRSRSE